VLQCLALAAAVAAPEDDHRRGLQAYNTGDVATAMSVLRAPANAGHAPSQSLLAFILDRGDFVEEAARLYTLAAAQGDAEAQAALGNFYLTGRGVAKDEKQALSYFSKAAEQGHVLSMQVLAKAYRDGSFGLQPDAVQAARWEARIAEIRGTPRAATPNKARP
jgi:TPR repeat protein